MSEVLPLGVSHGSLCLSEPRSSAPIVCWEGKQKEAASLPEGCWEDLRDYPELALQFLLISLTPGKGRAERRGLDLRVAEPRKVEAGRCELS